MEKVKKIVFITGIVLAVLDLGYLNYHALMPSTQLYPSIIKETKEVVKNNISTPVTNDSCYPFSCIDLIRQATASISLSDSKKQLAPNITPSSTAASAAKEYYVTFGSGQTSSDQYEDVPGLQAYIDSTKYGKIKKTTFEVAMRIPTANGRMYAQLINSTDQHPVWSSEVSSEGNTSSLVVSSPITLDNGNKLYKVQAKTTLKYSSLVDQARVHIITE